MRLRNKQWAKPLILAHPEMILVRPEKMQGHWQSRFDQVRHCILRSALGRANLLSKWPRPIQTETLLL
jgi:tRNA (guanine-N7-)-methyltransferase